MLIVGHRGARALEPENTLRAIRAGMACADYVEVDVRLSRDGVPVVIHDASVDRTTDGAGAVRDLTLRELKALDAGCGAEVPTLGEALDCVRGKCGLVVEIKDADGVEEICRLLRERGPKKLFIVSFDAAAVRKAGGIVPGAMTGLIVSHADPDPIEAALSIGADGVASDDPCAAREYLQGVRTHRTVSSSF